MVVLSCIEDGIQGMGIEELGIDSMRARQRVKAVQNEEYIEELARQLRLDEGLSKMRSRLE